MAAKKDTAPKTVATAKKPGKVESLVFFGTPEFAVPSLDALVEAGRRPALVVTKPARPAGRGKQLQEPPVAERARELGLEVAQPEKVRDEEFLARMEELAPDLAAVVAFGQIFPQRLLDVPRLGCINVHASLLPKYRGAAPIQAALVEGERKTGITTMQMEAELDAGPILLQEETAIRAWETAGELTERMAKMGADLLVETIDQLEAGKLKPRKQREESASYAGVIDKSQGKLNWALKADEIYNRIRAYTPWPGVITHFRGRPIKILWGEPITWESAPIGETGTYLGLRQGRIAVLAGGNTILGIEELQRAGKKPVRSSDFVHGEHLRVGERFA
ncbi:MAG TPA: methionyl-tRNA formyltransferase [Thermoanaerobaculia bacterium]|nr:methionyl-tRNA formyltransferase [Thermoanaerobaculia bacterium]